MLHVYRQVNEKNAIHYILNQFALDNLVTVNMKKTLHPSPFTNKASLSENSLPVNELLMHINKKLL